MNFASPIWVTQSKKIVHCGEWNMFDFVCKEIAHKDPNFVLDNSE
jgi:hypothetical protein